MNADPFRRAWRSSAVALVMLATAAGLAAQERNPERLSDYYGSSEELVWRGTQALKICNGLFVSGRTLDQIYREELTGLRPRGPMSQSRVNIHRGLRAVEVGVEGADGISPMRAAYRDGLGCIVMAPHQDLSDIESLPSRTPYVYDDDPSTIPWPNGDLIDESVPSPPGIDVRALSAASDWAFDRVGHGGHEGQITTGLLVVHQGRIVLERYAPGFDANTVTRTWSTAKSIASTLIGIAVDQGLLQLDAPLPVEWLPRTPEGVVDPRSQVTLRHALQMSSGLYPMDNEYNWVRGSHMVYFAGWDAGYHPRDRGLIHEPGGVFEYENYDTLLALLSLRLAIGHDEEFLEFPHRHLFQRIGMRSTLPGVDRFGNYILSSQVYTNARDLARLGLLFLNRGEWNGERIISEEWLDFALSPAPSTETTGRQYGAQIWLVPDSRTDLPQDAFSTQGAQGQFTIVVPSYDLVIVRRGLDWREGAAGRGLSSWDLLAEVLSAFEAREGGQKVPVMGSDRGAR